MADQALLRLRSGDFALDLCPRWGGAIAAFRKDDRALLRPAGETFLRHGDPHLAACFPLVPFSNRVADGRFSFQGRGYELAKNFRPEPHAIHGYGWQNPWAVAEASPSRAELTFRHTVPSTPFHYRARQVFALGENGLEIALNRRTATRALRQDDEGVRLRHRSA